MLFEWIKGFVDICTHVPPLGCLPQLIQDLPVLDYERAALNLGTEEIESQIGQPADGNARLLLNFFDTLMRCRRNRQGF